jgi:hypothetical protein
MASRTTVALAAGGGALLGAVLGSVLGGGYARMGRGLSIKDEGDLRLWLAGGGAALGAGLAGGYVATTPNGVTAATPAQVTAANQAAAATAALGQ